MPSLLSLPREILHCIFSYTDRQSRKELRLSSKLLSTTGQSWVFQSTKVSRERSSCERFQNILDRPDLASAVTKVYLSTESGNYDPELEQMNLEDGDEYLEADEADEDEDSALPPWFWRVVNRLHQLPRLQSVVLIFHPDCDGGENDWGDVQQTTSFRDAVIQKTMSILASLPRLPRELGIQDLQNINPSDSGVVQDLEKVLGGVQSLRLNVANELDEGNGENNVTRAAVHEFFPTLSSFWLKPALGNLEHLTIYSSIYFGFYPKCDLSNVHLPHLKSLALGNYTFIHDSQLEWILSHGETLQELYLDDCPILHEVAVDSETKEQTALDPHTFKTHPRLQHKTHAYYSTRWADYLQAFNERLPHLRHFRIGHNPHWWEDDTTPFEREERIRIGFYESYMVYCDGFGPSQYMKRIIFDMDDGYVDGGVLKPSEDDEAALKRLLGKLGQSVDEDDDDDY
ncbi:hypothetical protein BDV12DRAFT_190563 [Aspergillus spectabilis]